MTQRTRSTAKSNGHKRVAARKAAEPRKRLRLLGFDIVLSFAIDDGDTLTPQQSQPIRIPANEWKVWVESGLDGAIADAEKQLNGDSA